MLPIQTVLVATDFTKHSIGALAHGVELAQDSPLVRLHVAYVKPEMGAVMPEPYLTTSELLRDDTNGARLELWHLQLRVLDFGVDCEVHLVRGDPAAEIRGLAKRIGADLIVMGVRETGGLRRFLFGSVSEQVCRSAPCPVTVVRSGLASADAVHLLERDAGDSPSLSMPSQL
jgi:nucleotide-binding universal stress UspA family protein